MASLPVVTFDRTVRPAMETCLKAGGPLHGLVERSRDSGGMFDLQLRANPKTKAGWASVYVGLTSVLDIDEAGGSFRLRAHLTHQRAVRKTDGAFDPAWGELMSLDELALRAPAIFAYLDAICGGGVGASHTDKEGRIQGLLCTGTDQTTVGFQREAVMAFLSAPVKKALVEPLKRRILAAAAAGAPDPAPKWWPGVRDHGAEPRLGLEIDVLGVDAAGRLLVIEVKPPNTVEGITWAPAQVRLYADIVALWLEVDPDARERIIEMCEQRSRMGLPAPLARLPPAAAIRVVPVVAIGEGKQSPEAMGRMSAVYDAVRSAPSHSARMDPMEVWMIADNGSIEQVPGPWSAA